MVKQITTITDENGLKSQLREHLIRIDRIAICNMAYISIHGENISELHEFSKLLRNTLMKIQNSVNT